MPNVHAPPNDTWGAVALDAAGEQLARCREDILSGVRLLRSEGAPQLAHVRQMCDAVIEYFEAFTAYERHVKALRVDELADQAQRVAYLEEQANPDAFLR